MDVWLILDVTAGRESVYGVHDTREGATQSIGLTEADWRRDTKSQWFAGNPAGDHWLLRRTRMQRKQ